MPQTSKWKVFSTMGVLVRFMFASMACISVLVMAILQQTQRSVRQLGGQQTIMGLNEPGHRRLVVVLSVWFNYPELLRAHTASVRAFLTHEAHPVVEVVVVNNARSADIQQQIRETANELQVHHIQVPDALTHEASPSMSHAHALESALDILVGESDSDSVLSPPFPQQYDMLLIVDSDMFFMDRTSLVTELKGAAMASPLQRREAASPYPASTYMWPNLSLFSFGEWYVNRPEKSRLSKLLSVDVEPVYRTLYQELKFRNCGPKPCFNCDSGGCTKQFMMNHPDLMVVDWGFEHEFESCQGKDDRFSSEACRYWKKQVALGQPPGCAVPTLSGPVYHMGSAGSNWRGCSEDWLREQRELVQVHVQQIIPKETMNFHFPLSGNRRDV